MAADDSHPMPGTIAPASQPSHRGAPPPVAVDAAASPHAPTRRDLTTWWRQFKKNTKKEDEKVDEPQGIFGVPLGVSIKYANVAISLTNEQGESFIYGYVPIVVAKCGVYLKEKATDVEGIFRLSGSAKRIKDLQAIFNSPDRYGKGLDWTGYTVHDAANIFRRYLNQLPEPIIPLEFYERFREPLRSHQVQAVGDMEAQGTESGDFNHDAAVTTYQRLITELPPLNRQLLLYILDLLAVFASKSDLNRMTAANLAAIFQPGIVSHPQHDMSPAEYRLSQDVLIFLIENQDNFLIGMTGTAVDEKTVREVQSGALPSQTSKANVGRSASNASAGADSLRKFGGVRRNVSVSSRNSRGSGSAPSPVTPSSGVAFASNATGSGLNRSNTVPSKKSPGLTSGRFGKPSEPSTPTSTNAASPGNPGSYAPAGSNVATQQYVVSSDRSAPQASDSGNPVAAVQVTAPTAVSPEARLEQPTQYEKHPVNDSALSASAGLEPPLNAHTPTKERKISNLFAKSSQPEAEKKETRQPNRLKKRQRIPGSANGSAQSSQNSLHAESPVTPAFHTPMLSPTGNERSDPMSAAAVPPAFSTTVPTPSNEAPPHQAHEVHHHSALANESHVYQNQAAALKPPKSPEPSIHSRSSVTDQSDFDQVDDPTAKAEKRRNRWRFSSSAKKNDDPPLAPPPQIGSNPGAGFSNGSLGSSNRPRKSFTGDSQQLGTDQSSTGYPSTVPLSTQESELTKDSPLETERKGGLFGRLKAKVAQSKEEKERRDAEKERAKSPPRGEVEKGTSRHSLSAFAQEHLPYRGRSMDLPREGKEQVVVEPPTPTPGAQPNSSRPPPPVSNQGPQQ